MSGIVYAITHGGMTYFGSSNQCENDRWCQHKEKNKNDTLTCSSKIIFLRAALDEELPTFTVLEKFDDIDRTETRKIEQWYIDNFECVNALNAFISIDKIAENVKTYYIENKENIAEQNKAYRIKNRNNIAEQRREYYVQNKEKIAEYKKTYQVKNRESITEQRKEYHRKYREQNKELIIQKQRERRAKKRLAVQSVVL